MATGRVHHQGGQVVWPTKEATGRAPQSPYTATSVHALRVAAVTAQLRAAGVSSVEDLADFRARHRVADAVLSWPGGEREFLEVELTPKQPDALRAKLMRMRDRWSAEGVDGTLYVAVPAAARAVERVAGQVMPDDQRHRLRVVDVDQVTASTWAAAPDHSPTLMAEPAPAADRGWNFDA